LEFLPAAPINLSAQLESVFIPIPLVSFPSRELAWFCRFQVLLIPFSLRFFMDFFPFILLLFVRTALQTNSPCGSHSSSPGEFSSFLFLFSFVAIDISVICFVRRYLRWTLFAGFPVWPSVCCFAVVISEEENQRPFFCLSPSPC